MSKSNAKKKASAKTAPVVRADNSKAPKGKSSKKPAAEVAVVDADIIDAAAAMSEDEILASLDSAAIETSEATAEEVETVTPINVEEVYATMKSDLPISDEADVEATGRKTEGKAEGKTKGKAKAKRETVKAGESAPRRAIDPERLAAIVGEEEANRLIVESGALPVKIRDKATNAISAILNGTRVSGYTEKAINHLRAAPENSATSKDIIGMYRENRYSPGTAAAQAQQQMVLLNYLGVAKRDGRTLKLVTDSPLLTAIAA